MIFELHRPSYLTVYFDNPVGFFTVQNSENDSAYFKYFVEPVKSWSFNLMLPDKYLITPNPCKVNFSEPKQMINDITLPEPDWYPETEPEIFFDESFAGVAYTIPAKCQIVIGQKYWTLPEFARIFALIHEYGHLYYHSEINADLYALYHFCKMGFNPSSALYSTDMYIRDCAENNQRLVSNYQTVLRNC